MRATSDIARAGGASAGASRAAVELRGVSKRFGSSRVLESIDLRVGRGELVALLGPSGCGKTTLLRLIAGLETPDAGRVLLDGRDVTDAPASGRSVNTVFQNSALFPHLNVRDNVAFGLRARRVAEAEVRSRVERALSLVRAGELAQRGVETLSGGQRQRVALARAIVNEPDVLLLDEPMSALDAKLRGELQGELRGLHRSLGSAFVLVTHDQDEALSVADRVVVIRAGNIEQDGSPREVYERPRTRFVADFVGGANLIPVSGGGEDSCVETVLGELRVASGGLAGAGALGAHGSHGAWLCIRPEHARWSVSRPAGNGVEAVMLEVVFRGDHVEMRCRSVLGGLTLRVIAPEAESASAGKSGWIALPAERLMVVHG